MLIVAPDFDRRIDLPGAGSCPRPVDIDRSRADLSHLVSLRIYSFAAGAAIDGEAEGDEVFIVLMRGAADVAVDHAGRRVGDFPLRVDAGLRGVYLPPHASYRLTAMHDCDIAYARARPSVPHFPWPAAFQGSEDGRLDIRDHAVGMALTLETLSAGTTRLLVAGDGASPERFVHVRSSDGGVALLSGERLGDWSSAILADGEAASVEIAGGPVDILTVTATQY